MGLPAVSPITESFSNVAARNPIQPPTPRKTTGKKINRDIQVKIKKIVATLSRLSRKYKKKIAG